MSATPHTPGPPAPAAPDERTPWLGLDAFTAAEQERFRGRDADVEELTQRVKREVGTVLYGQSGLGKTSLLQAGLAPRLAREHYVSVVIRLIHKSDAPLLMEQVRAEITRALQRAALFEPVFPEEREDLWRYLHRRDVPFLTQDGYDVRLVLIFDQFEEIFTNGQATPAQAHRSKEFFAHLAELIQGRTPESVKAELQAAPETAEKLKLRDHDYHVLVSLREDYLPHLDTAVERFVAPDLVRNRQRLLPFDGLGALAVVEEPGAGLLEAGVAEKIVRRVAAARQRHLSVSFLGENDEAPLEMADLRVEPALLSLLCSRLNAVRLERQKQSGVRELITADLVKVMGGQVLDDFYHQALASLPRRAQGPMANFIQENLISESGQFRQQVVFDSAEKHLTDRGIPLAVATGCFDTLIRKQRLLRMEDRGDVRRVELTHDVLCSVVAHCRDEHRARQHRVQWWKNVATAAAVVFFLCAIVLGIVAVRKAEAAERLRAHAAAFQAEVAMEAKGEISHKLGNWYHQRIAQAAQMKDLAGAALLRANGTVKADLPAPQALAYIAPPPLLQPLGRVKLAGLPGKDDSGKGAPGVEGVTRVQWLNTGRCLFALTKPGHLCVAADLSRPPSWLVQSEQGLSLAPQSGVPATEAKRVAVNCAIAWVDENGVEGILAGLKGGGAWFVPVTGPAPPSSRLPKEAGEVTALVQSRDSGATWAGLANGLVVLLAKDARSAGMDAPFLCAAPLPRKFAPDRAWRSPQGRWLYVPIARDPTRDPRGRQWALVDLGKDFRLPAGDANADNTEIGSDNVVTSERAGPSGAPVRFGAALPVVEWLTDDRPVELVFSPDDRFCLVGTTPYNETKLSWTRIALPAARPSLASARPADISKDDAPTHAGAAGDARTATHAKDLDTQRLTGAQGGTALTFLDDDCFVTASELKLDAFSVSDPQQHTSLALEPTGHNPGASDGHISQLVASGHETRLLVLLNDADDNIAGFRVLSRDRAAPAPKLALLASVQLRSPTPVAPAFLRDGSGVFWEDAVEDVSAPGKTPSASATAPARMIYWLELSSSARPAPFPWRERTAQLPLNRVGGLAFDTEGGVLCASAETGVACLSPKTGQLVSGTFLRCANPQPETLVSRPGANEFTAQVDERHYWRLSISAYSPAEGPTIESQNLDTDPIDPSEPGTVGVGFHPDGSTQVLSVKGAVDAECALELKTADTEPVERLSLPGFPMTALGFSADGRVLAGGNDKGDLAWWSVDRERRAKAPLFSTSGGAGYTPQIAADGRGGFFLADVSGLHRWQPRTGGLEALPLPEKTKRVLAVAAASAPGGRVNALVETLDHRLLVCAPDTAAELAAAPLSESRHFALPPELPLDLKWHTIIDAAVAPDGYAVVLFGQEGLVELWRREGAHLLPVLLPDEVKAAAAAFDTKGSVLLFGAGLKSWLVRWDSPAAPPQIASTPLAILAAAFVPALDRFLVSFEKTGLASVDPAHFAEAAPDESAETTTLPTQILVSPDSSFAVVRSNDSVQLYDPRVLRSLGPLAAAPPDAFSEGGCVVSGADPAIVGLAADQASAWRPGAAWSLEEATQRTGLQIDDDLNVTRVTASAERAAAPIAIPPADPALARDWQVLNRFPLEVRSGHPPAAEDEPPGLAETGQSLPPDLRTELTEWRQAATHSGRDARYGAWFLDRIRGNLPLAFVADEPVPAGEGWPAALRADFVRTVTVAKWNRLLGDKDVKTLLTPDQFQFLPALQGAGAKFIETLRQAWDDGGTCDIDAPRLGEALAAIQAALDADTVHPDEAEKHQAGIALWQALGAEPRSVRWWNSYGARLGRAPVDAASNAKDKDGITERQALCMRLYQRAVNLFERDPSSQEKDVHYPLSNWAELLNGVGSRLPLAEAERWKHAAIDRARQAVHSKGSTARTWKVLADISWVEDEKLSAAQNRVALARRGDRDELVNALTSLGAKYENAQRLEALPVLEEVLTLTAKNGHPTDSQLLADIGEFMRRFGGTDAEWHEPFSAALELEADNLADLRKAVEKAAGTPKLDAAKATLADAEDSRSDWIRARLGLALQEHGDAPAAATLYGEAWEIAQAEKSHDAWVLSYAACLALDSQDLTTAGKFLSDMEQTTLWKLESTHWLYLARVARQWLFRFPGDARATDLAGRVLQETEHAVADDWMARAYAFDALGRTDAALKTLQDHEDLARRIYPDQVDASFWRIDHEMRGELLAKKNTHESLWHFAQAVGYGWQDAAEFTLEPMVVEKLKNEPLFQQLRAALSLRYGDPERYLALARFIQATLADWRQHGGQVAPEDEAALLITPLSQATSFGWRDSDHLLDPGKAFQSVNLASDWPDKYAAARGEAVDHLRHDLTALAAAWSQSWVEMKSEHKPSTLLQHLLPKVIAHALLKRNQGRDLFGNSYQVDTFSRAVSISPQTRQIVADWKDVDDDFWTIKVEPPKVDDKPPASSP